MPECANEADDAGHECQGRGSAVKGALARFGSATRRPRTFATGIGRRVADVAEPLALSCRPAATPGFDRGRKSQAASRPAHKNLPGKRESFLCSFASLVPPAGRRSVRRIARLFESRPERRGKRRRLVFRRRARHSEDAEGARQERVTLGGVLADSEAVQRRCSSARGRDEILVGALPAARCPGAHLSCSLRAGSKMTVAFEVILPDRSRSTKLACGNALRPFAVASRCP